jgi:hypothetical protein
MKSKFFKVIPVFAILVLVFFNVFVTINNETRSATLGSIKAMALDDPENGNPVNYRRCVIGIPATYGPIVLHCADCAYRRLRVFSWGGC